MGEGVTVTRDPTGQDLMCLVCLKPAQDIDHVVNRGMGGSKERDVPENKVPLCRECHDLKTVGRIETWVMQSDQGNWYYRWRQNKRDGYWITVPVEVSKRYKCLVRTEVVPDADRQPQEFDQREVGRDGQVLSDGAEDGTAGAAVEYLTAEGQGNAPDSRQRHINHSDTGSSAPSPSAGGADRAGSSKAERSADNREYVGSNPTRPDSAPSGEGSSAVEHQSYKLAGAGSNPAPPTTSNPLTHEQRVAISKEIQNAEWNRQWFAGDTGNQWITELGESAEQYLSDFGYQPESLSNILRVCAAIKPPYRNGKLRFSHHTVVYELPPEERMRWLTECEAEGWSVAEFRRQVKGTKPRVKRWSLEELRQQVAILWPAGSDVVEHVNAFLDWLDGQA